MLKVKAWTLYDLGNAYGFALQDGDILRETDNINQPEMEPAHTYIRLVFTFELSNEDNLKVLRENKIEYGRMSEHIGYFTSDITYFPTASIPKFKLCVTEELEALCNIKSPVPEIKDYLGWFIRNVDTVDSVYVDVYLERDMLIMENEAKMYAPLVEIYSRMVINNPLKDRLKNIYGIKMRQYAKI